ncbi:syndecan-2-like isoform X2 [Hoplias malabaricus]|uniref:syndecan-2-like isoform X2 n=1 Tax=Hoplias malabaricus TaxID=27720 RepID=UPI0034619CDE
MRIGSVTALLICLSLWIPAAQLQHTTVPPEDDDTSGDDLEISGSGSGDDGSVPTEVVTHASSKTTKTAWVTDPPVRIPDPTVSQLSSTLIPHADVETAASTTKAPLLQTTKELETQPSPTTAKPLVRFKVPEIETTTIHQVEQKETTTLPEEKLPMVPQTTEPSTTTTSTKDSEEQTTKAVALDEYEENKVPVDVADLSTDAPEAEATTLFLTTTSASEVADPVDSEDRVEFTTLMATIDDGVIGKNDISEVHREPEPTTSDDGDFDFDSELDSKRISPDSEVPLGASSDDGSLLERTEVLAGVIAGGLVGLAFAIMLVALMIYRMKKKDEGSYSLDDHKPHGGYQKPVAQEEFLA